MTFTFEELLELPRPSPAVLNPSRTRALWPCTTFSFAAADGKGRTEKFLSLVDLCSQSETKPQTVLEHLHFLEAVWIDDDTFLFLRPPYVASSPADSQDAGSTKQAVRPADHPVDISDKKQGDRMKEIAEKDAGVEVWAKNVSAGGGEYRVGRLPVACVNQTSMRLLAHSDLLFNTESRISRLSRLVKTAQFLLLAPPCTQVRVASLRGASRRTHLQC